LSKATTEQTAESKALAIEAAGVKDNDTVGKIADVIGMTRKQIYVWLRDDKEFAKAFAVARMDSLDERVEMHEKQLEQWASDPTMKVGMVNFLAKMAWLKAHRPEKWNEKSFSKIEKTEKKITTIEVRLPSRINSPVEAKMVEEAGKELKINLLNEGVNDDTDATEAV
jgi:hypothetical protein